MFCDKCGREIEDGAKFCDYCGRKFDDQVIEEMKVPEKEEAKVVAAPPAAVPDDDNAAEKKKRLVLIIIGIVIVLAGIGLAIFLLSGNDRDDDLMEDDYETEFLEEDDMDSADLSDDMESSDEYDEEEAIADMEAAQHVFANRGTGGDEDSFASYNEAIEQGAEYIEQDIVLADDGELYVSYSKKSAAELRSQGNPTLREVFDRYGNSVTYVVEIKSRDEATTSAFIDLVREYDYEDQVIAQCFESWILRDIRNAFPDMPTLLLCDNKHGGQNSIDDALDEEYIDIISVSKDDGMMTGNNIRNIHEAGKEFNAWVLDDEESIKRAIKMGVDSYFTRKPGLAIDLEKEYREN